MLYHCKPSPNPQDTVKQAEMEMLPDQVREHIMVLMNSVSLCNLV